MKTILAQNNGSPSNAATRYYPFGIGGVAASVQTNSANAPTPMSVAGTVTGARGTLPTTITTGSYTVTLMRSTGGAAFADTTLIGTTSIGSADITFTGSATVLAGDLFLWKVVPASTPDSQTNIILSATFEATTSGKGVILAGAASSTGTKHMQPGAFSDAARTSTNASCPMPTAGVIDRIDVKLSAAPGAAASKTVTIYQNGVSAGSVTVSNTDTQNSATGLAISWAQGDLIRLEETASGAAASITYVSLDWTPTINGEAVCFGSQVSAQSTSSNSYGFVNGSAAGGGGTAATYPELVSTDCTAKKLSVITDVSPGVGNSRVISFVKGGVAQSLSQAADTTVATDTTNTVDLVAGDVMAMQNDPTGTPTANTATRWGLVLATTAAATGSAGNLLLLGVG